MKAMVILNPHAHSGSTIQQIEALHSEISDQLKEALHLDSVAWCETEHPGHGRELAQDATKNGYDYIFAGGGDGTINEVLNGIMSLTPKRDVNQRPTFGVLPFGTSNDFFAALKTAEASCSGNGEHNLTLSMDVGHVLFDNVERYFCLTTGMGLISWANEQYLDASHAFGRRFAHIPAAIKTLRSYRFLPNVTISRNGKQSRQRRILSIVVDNSPVVAGGIPLTPNAKIDDGQLDVCLVKPVSPLRMLWLLLLVTTGTHTHSRYFELGKISEITIMAKQALPIHVDGELVPELDSKARSMTVKVMPGALRVVVPSICELVTKPRAPMTTPAPQPK